MRMFTIITRILNKPGKILKNAGLFAESINPEYFC